MHGGWETSALRHSRATDQIGKCTADCCLLLPQTNALCVVILCIHITVHTRYIYDFPVSRPHRKPPGVWLGVYRYPAYNEVGVPNLQKCRVPIFFNNTELTEVSGTNKQNEFYEVSGTGVETIPKLVEVSGPGIKAVPNKYRYARFWVRGYTGTQGIVGSGYRTPRSLECRHSKHTELAEVPGASIQRAPNLQKCRVPVLKSTEHTEESGAGVSRNNAPGRLRYVPYRTYLWMITHQ